MDSVQFNEHFIFRIKSHAFVGNVKINFLSQIEYCIPFIPGKKNEKRR